MGLTSCHSADHPIKNVFSYDERASERASEREREREGEREFENVIARARERAV